MAKLMIENIKIKENILQDEKYKYLFSVEVVNNLVLDGVPFREAYKKVGLDIENGTFTTDTKVNHTHEGSIGNLCTANIKNMMDKVLADVNFDKVNKAVEALLA